MCPLLKGGRGTLAVGNKPGDHGRRTGADDEGTGRDFEAMAKKMTWLEAAEIIGVCDRRMRRMRERYQEFG